MSINSRFTPPAKSLIVLVTVGLFVAATRGDHPSNHALDGKANRTSTVVDFGAIGDGVHDDTQAIQRMIDSGAGAIRFPVGKYRISKPLVMPLDNGNSAEVMADGPVQLIMAGPGPTIRLQGRPAATAEPATGSSRLFIDGVAIIGDHVESDGIEATNASRLILRDIHISNCRHAVQLIGRNSNVLIEGCRFFDNGGCGIYSNQADVHQATITASHISFCAGGGIVMRGGDLRNLNISGCDLQSNGETDPLTAANIYLDCTEGSAAEIAVTGCTMSYAKVVPHSANIRIIGPGLNDAGKPEPAPACGRIAIGNNVLSGAHSNIHLVGARSVTVAGNTISQGIDHGVFVEESEEVLVGPNMCEQTSHYNVPNAGHNSMIFRASRDCTIQGLHLQNVQGCEAGITLDKCHRVNLDQCSILDCDNIGLLIRDCTGCRVGINNFIRHARGWTDTVPIKVVRGSGNRIQDFGHFDP